MKNKNNRNKVSSQIPIEGKRLFEVVTCIEIQLQED
jgi:hypothetical protein